MLKVNLPDGSHRECSTPVSSYDIASDIGPGLAKAAVAAEVDAQLTDLHAPLPNEGEIELRLLTKTRSRSPRHLAPFMCACDGAGCDAALRRGAIGVWTLY